MRPPLAPDPTSRSHLTLASAARSLWGFPLTCPANSRLRRAYDGLEIDTLPRGPSFVADHLQTMNLCDNPEWQYLHGASASLFLPWCISSTRS